MSYESGVEELYDVGPPYVSPRDPGQPISIKPPELGSGEDYKQVIEALAVRVFVVEGVWPSWFMAKHGLPETFEGLPEWLREAIIDSKESPDEPLTRAAARLVKMDYWPDLNKTIEAYLVKKGYRLKEEMSAIPEPDIEFVERIACTADTLKEVSDRFEKCFQAKGYYKTLRPVGKILKYLGIESRFRQSIHETLQEYPHPGHFSFPAGHGTDAGATAWGVIHRWDIPEKVVNDIILGCRAFAHFRTFSLMHIPVENEVGYKLGEGSI